VKRPLGDELLFGQLEKGGTVEVDAVEGKLTFKLTPSEPRDDDEPTQPAKAARGDAAANVPAVAPAKAGDAAGEKVRDSADVKTPGSAPAKVPEGPATKVPDGSAAKAPEPNKKPRLN
jgi:ATP-dependent Clp protease ATP-binding subunit ClpA